MAGRWPGASHGHPSQPGDRYLVTAPHGSQAQNELRTLTPPPRALALSSHIFQILFSWNPLVFLIELYRGQTDETRINEECPRRDRQEQRGPSSWRSCTLLEPLPLQRKTVSFPLPWPGHSQRPFLGTSSVHFLVLKKHQHVDYRVQSCAI